MDALFLILGVFLGVLAILASYHIAAKQGAFRKSAVLLTVSDPVQRRIQGQPLTRYAKSFQVGNLTPPQRANPFMLEMPVLISFGVPDRNRPRMLFLPLTLVNHRKHAVPDVFIHFRLPAKFMPDKDLPFEPPEGLNAKFSTDEAAQEWLVEYSICSQTLRQHKHPATPFR